RLSRLHTWQSEAGQVLLDLPGRDLLVVARPFVALHLDEVVDVVLVAAAAERLPQDLVALELARRVEQVCRQELDPLLFQVATRGRVEVAAHRLAWIELVLDAVHAGGEQDGRREIRVARAVDRAVLDSTRPRYAEHLRAVVVAVADVDGRPRRAARRRPVLEPLVRVDGRRRDRDVGL